MGLSFNEKVEYLMHTAVYDEILQLVDNVLSDSEADPEFSAVTANNQIKIYIDIMKELGKPCPYDDVKGYFKFEAYTEEEYQIFENKRIKESSYYIGKQF